MKLPLREVFVFLLVVGLVCLGLAVWMALLSVPSASASNVRVLSVFFAGLALYLFVASYWGLRRKSTP